MIQPCVPSGRNRTGLVHWISTFGYAGARPTRPGGRVAAAGALAMCVATAAAAGGGTLFVDAANAPGGDGSDWANALPGLREALALAGEPGATITEIWVARGRYVPAAPDDIGSSFQLRSGLAIYGGFAGGESSRDQRDWIAHETILSGDVGDDDVYGNPVWYSGWNIHTPNSLHVLTAQDADATAILDGFTITAGRATSSAGGGLMVVGGGPTIRNCTFLRNLAAFGHGGGVYVHDADPTFIDCAFIQNWVHLGQGAGIYAAGPAAVAVRDCVFTENRSIGSTPEAAGGAIATGFDVDLVVEHSTFQSNVAENFYPSGSTAGGYGGAIHHMGGALTVNRSRFIGNRSNAGGAIWTWRDARIVNSLFRLNQAPEYQAQQGGWGGLGGAIGASAFTGTLVQVINCTVVQNSAKKGGGLRFMQSADADVVNGILWANTDQDGMVGTSQIKGAGARFSCIQNMLIGEAGEDPPDPEHFPDCFDDDPLLSGLGAGDVHLLDGSPCIDAGSNAAVPPEAIVDLDGGARVVDGNGDSAAIVDLGVFESRPPGIPGDLNGDGMIGAADLLILLSQWGSCGDPGDCPADLTGDGTVGGSDLLVLLSHWV